MNSFQNPFLLMIMGDLNAAIYMYIYIYRGILIINQPVYIYIYSGMTDVEHAHMSSHQ